MFEMFGGFIFRSMRYLVEELEREKTYYVSHIDAEKRAKWCRLKHKVEVDMVLGKFLCECGLFEHMGMLCCHSIKVRISMPTQQIKHATTLDCIIGIIFV